MSDTLPAVFIRGGTNKALMLHLRDLPASHNVWKDRFLKVIDSPNSYGQELNGMGGGASSLSKNSAVAPSARADAHMDCSFVQMAVHNAQIDMSGNCGNMPSAIGPFAGDKQLVAPEIGQTTVRLFNINTSQIIHARFPTEAKGTIYGGDCVIPGVPGSGAPIRLDYLDPGGGTTGKLMPTGPPREQVKVDGREFKASMVDAGNACVFVHARDLGNVGNNPARAKYRNNSRLLGLLEGIRIAVSMRMGISKDRGEATRVRHVYFVVIVSGPQEALTTSGEWTRAADMKLSAGVISNGQPHQALPLTATLCTTIAANIPGPTVNSVASPASHGPFNIGIAYGNLSFQRSVHQRRSARFL